MNIRAWLGYESKESLSQVDQVVDDILNSYYSISEKFAKGQNLNNIKELAAVVKNDSSNEIYLGFVNWFNEEGKEFLVNTARFLYENDDVLKEELTYLQFIVSDEANNTDDYPCDVIGILVDISDQMKSLLQKATVSFELSELHTFWIYNVVNSDVPMNYTHLTKHNYHSDGYNTV